MDHLGVSTEDLEGHSPSCLLKWCVEDLERCPAVLVLTGDEGRGLTINHSTEAVQGAWRAGAQAVLSRRPA